MKIKEIVMKNLGKIILCFCICFKIYAMEESESREQNQQSRAVAMIKYLDLDKVANCLEQIDKTVEDVKKRFILIETDLPKKANYLKEEDDVLPIIGISSVTLLALFTILIYS